MWKVEIYFIRCVRSVGMRLALASAFKGTNKLDFNHGLFAEDERSEEVMSYTYTNKTFSYSIMPTRNMRF